MKKIFLTVVLLLSIIAANADDHKVLIEKFYDTKDARCHRFEEEFNSYVHLYDEHIVQVEYHFDSDTIDIDPFFAVAEHEQCSRVSYYNVRRNPVFLVNSFQQSSAEEANTTILSNIGIAASIDIDAEFIGDSIRIVFDISEAIESEHIVLNVMITESSILYEAASGATVFNNIFRKAIPDINGTIIDFSTTGTRIITLPYEYPYEFSSYDNLSLVVFLQDRFSKKVINVNSFDIPETPNDAVAFSVEDDRIVEKSNTFAMVGHLRFKNVGSTYNRYHVTMEADCPDSWSKSYCTSTACWPFSSPFDTLLHPGEHEEITIDVYPMGNPGSGTITVNVESGISGDVASVVLQFVAVDDGSYDVLCVLDEGFDHNLSI